MSSGTPHIIRRHPSARFSTCVSSACDACCISKSRCDGKLSCGLCAWRNIECRWTTRVDKWSHAVVPREQLIALHRRVVEIEQDLLLRNEDGTRKDPLSISIGDGLLPHPSPLSIPVSEIPLPCTTPNDTGVLSVISPLRLDSHFFLTGNTAYIRQRCQSEPVHPCIDSDTVWTSSRLGIIYWNNSRRIDEPAPTHPVSVLKNLDVDSVLVFPLLGGEENVEVTVIRNTYQSGRTVTLKASANIGGHCQHLALKHIIVAPGRQQEVNRVVNAWRRAIHERLQPLLGVLREDFENAGEHILASPWADNGNMLEYLRLTAVASRKVLIQQVAEGVLYLHSTLGIVHGDIKCENVLIDADGNALLTDFGLSTFLQKDQDDKTTTTVSRGRFTLEFSAPELLIDEAFDGTRKRSKTVQSDVYAFGMLVLQAFTLLRPWHTLDNDAQLVLGVVHGAVPERPGPQSSALRYGLDDAIWDMCIQCWKRLPHERPHMSAVFQMLRAARNTAVPWQSNELRDADGIFQAMNDPQV